MSMKKSRRKGDIKSKLVAAVCMLMVSCIMVVSSTYAWFTLSTAPEVTGITTAIGANGNLEMALLPNGTSVAEALASIGNADGSQTGTAVNTTWGNLVDLSDAGYGLGNISLYPSKLYTQTLNSGATVLKDNYLQVPQYGVDGRVQESFAAATSKIYSNGSFSANGWGVRGVGTDSGKSARQTAYDLALSNANSAKNSAVALAQTFISDGGSSLLSIGVKHAMDSSATYDSTDISSLKSAYIALNNALDEVEESLMYYIKAHYLATLTDDKMEQLETFESSYNKGGIAALSTYVSGNTQLQAAITALTEMQTKASSAQSALDSMSGSKTWDDIDEYITALATVNNITVNGASVSELKNALFPNNSLDTNAALELASNAQAVIPGTDNGMYAKLAAFVGTYGSTFSAPVKFTYNESEQSVSIKGTMTVEKPASPADTYLQTAKTLATTDVEFKGSGSGALSELYGYIIDLAFRTNAAGSNLLLKTDAIDRVSSTNGTESKTMGGGSTMEFVHTFEETDFTEMMEIVEGQETKKGTGTYNDGKDGRNLELTEIAKDNLKKGLLNLIGNIEVVFFNPNTDSLSIYGYARLDVDNYKVEYDSKSNTYYVVCDLRMYDMVTDGEGEQAVTRRQFLDEDKQVITSLTQNEATAVSALVYLDGEKVTNADVGTVDINGTLNLQFASSAELKPMDYNFVDSDGNTTKDGPFNVKINGELLREEPLNSSSALVTVQKDSTWTYNLSTYISAAEAANKKITSVKVEMNGSEVTEAWDDNSKTITVSNVSADIIITITYTSNTGT